MSKCPNLKDEDEDNDDDNSYEHEWAINMSKMKLSGGCMPASYKFIDIKLHKIESA